MAEVEVLARAADVPDAGHDLNGCFPANRDVKATVWNWPYSVLHRPYEYDCDPRFASSTGGLSAVAALYASRDQRSSELLHLLGIEARSNQS